MVELVDCFCEDFGWWDLFDKVLWYVFYLWEGVIELMFVSDGMFFGFKYVNGYLKNIKEGF